MAPPVDDGHTKWERMRQPSTEDLRGKQSVRATFKLSPRAISAISVMALHLGIKQKSLFDHLMDDEAALPYSACYRSSSRNAKGTSGARKYSSKCSITSGRGRPCFNGPGSGLERRTRYVRILKRHCAPTFRRTKTLLRSSKRAVSSKIFDQRFL